MSIVQALPQVFYDDPADGLASTGYSYKWILQDSSSPNPRIEFDGDLTYGVIEDNSFVDTISDVYGRQYFVSSLCYGVCPE